MSSASDVAAGFSISGLLDAGAKTRSKYPVAELDIDAIEDNPANAVYSMEEAAIEALAESIEKDGLTDLPLVRKLTDGAGSSYRGTGAAPRSGCWPPRTPPIGRWAAVSSRA